VKVKRRFGGTYHHQLQGRRVSQARNWQQAEVTCFSYYSSLKMETIGSFKTSVNVHRTTRHYIPEDRTLQPSCCLKAITYAVNKALRRTRNTPNLPQLSVNLLRTETESVSQPIRSLTGSLFTSWLLVWWNSIYDMKGPIHNQSCCATLRIVQHDWPCMVLIDLIVNGQTCVAQNNFAQHDWSCIILEDPLHVPSPIRRCTIARHKLCCQTELT
jgi:hypothetical protein